MGFLDKLAFWKREEEIPEFPSIARGELKMPQEPSPFEQGPQPFQQAPFGQQQAQPQAFAQMQAFGQPASQEKDFQVISAKLDTLKAQLDSIEQRIARIEKIAEGQTTGRW